MGRNCFRSNFETPAWTREHATVQDVYSCLDRPAPSKQRDANRDYSRTALNYSSLNDSLVPSI